MPTQPLGWFKKPVAKVEDMKGLKFRTVGLAVDVFTDMGAAVNPLPGGEIVPALDRGLIDAADTANEVQGVIAHELGHIADGHVILGEQAMKPAMPRGTMAASAPPASMTGRVA